MGAIVTCEQSSKHLSFSVIYIYCVLIHFFVSFLFPPLVFHSNFSVFTYITFVFCARNDNYSIFCFFTDDHYADFISIVCPFSADTGYFDPG